MEDMAARLSPQGQRFREKYHRLKYGRWWWFFYYRLPTRLPWTLVGIQAILLIWCLFRSL